MTVKCCLNEKKRKENVKKENCMTIYETGVKKKKLQTRDKMNIICVQHFFLWYREKYEQPFNIRGRAIFFSLDVIFELTQPEIGFNVCFNISINKVFLFHVGNIRILLMPKLNFTNLFGDSKIMKINDRYVFAMCAIKSYKCFCLFFMEFFSVRTYFIFAIKWCNFNLG